MIDRKELLATIAKLREAISRACQDLRSLSLKGGNGADGDLWLEHQRIADDLFTESLWMHQGEKLFIPREEHANAISELRTQLFWANAEIRELRAIAEDTHGR